MKFKNIIIMLISAIIIIQAVSCNKSNGTDNSAYLPLLSLLVNKRLTVILKGTYATDRPLDFTEINNNSLFINPSVFPEDNVSVPSLSDLKILLDLGEIRLSSKPYPLLAVNDAEKAEEFWDIVSTERQVYCSHLYAIDNKYDTCWDSGGLWNFQSYMNGDGAVYPSRDPGPAAYLHAGIFMRGVVTGFNRINGLPELTTFDNNEVYGTQIMPYVNYNPGSTIADKEFQTPQFFPLHHQAEFGQHGLMNLNTGNHYAVLEIRSNIKENLMLHSVTTAAGKKITLVAFSDWNKPHANEPDIGGNVKTRGRIFYPDITRDLVIDGGTKSNRHYYAVYYSHECFDGTSKSCDKEKMLPYAATPVRAGNDNRLKNLMPGEYFLQCRYDEKYDGWPEKVLSEIKINIGAGPGVEKIACACGHSETEGCQ